jgi:hypothetical protein
MGIDGAAVVAAHVVALAIALGGVVAFPEPGEHGFQGGSGRVVDDLHHFGVVALAGPAQAQGALMLEDGVIAARDVAVGIAAFHVHHPGHFRHALFRAPEAAHAQDDAVQLDVGVAHGLAGGLAGPSIGGAGIAFPGAGVEQETQAEGHEQDMR